MPRAVLDTNVLVSAWLSPHGAPAQILVSWREWAFELVVSPLLMAELAGVLQLPKVARRATRDDTDAFLLDLWLNAVVALDPKHVPTAVDLDPADDFIVALARTARASVIVSGDRHLLRLQDLDPPVISPRAFLDRCEF